MRTLASTSKGKRRASKEFRRTAKDYEAGSDTRSKIELFLRTVLPEGKGPIRFDACEPLPLWYARHVMGRDADRDEYALVAHQLRIDAGVAPPPVLGEAGRELGQLPDRLASRLIEKRITLKGAESAVIVAATVYRLFQLWAMRPLEDRHLPLQLEPGFVLRWTQFPNDGAALLQRLRELHLQPRLEGAKFRQQAIRARNRMQDTSMSVKSSDQVTRALGLLRELEFIRKVQYLKRADGQYWIPRYELVGWPIPDPDVYSYTNMAHYRMKLEKAAAAKKARSKLTKRVA